MTDLPLVSVCIPSFNNEKTIERCLRSVCTQDYENVEILVVDDCSRDKTLEICEQFSKAVAVITNERNLGLVGNHNRCIDLANGKYVKFVHADDYLLPGAIARMTGALESFPEAVIALSRRTIDSTIDYVLRDSAELHGPLRPLSDCTEGVTLIERFVRDGAWRNLFGEPTSIMFNRDIAMRFGGFSHDLPQLLDVGFCLAILEHGAAVWIDDPLSVRVHTTENATESNRASGLGSLDILRLQLALTRSLTLSSRYRLIAGKLAVVSFTKALAKALIYGPRRPRVKELALLVRGYVAGDVRSPGDMNITDLSSGRR